MQEGFAFTAQVADLGVFDLGLFKIFCLQGQIHASFGQAPFEGADGIGEGALGIRLGFLNVSGLFLFILRFGLGFRAGLGFTFALRGQERFHFREQRLGLCGLAVVNLGHGNEPQVFGAIGGAAAGPQILSVL